MLIGYILDIAGKNLDSKLFHIPGGFGHYLIGKRIPVGVDGPQRQSADDLTHVALEGILQVGGDLGGFLI